MKIILAADIFPPDIVGPATYSKNLAKELINAGHKVEVICYADEKGEEKVDGYQVTKIDRSKPIFFRYLDYFLQLLKIGKSVDLIYAMGPVSAGLPVMLACKFLKKKYLVKVVGDYAWEQGRNRFGVIDGIDEFQDKKYSLKVEIFRFIQRRVVRNAEKVITPSYYLQDLVEGWGVNKKNIKVIYNAVNLSDVSIIDKLTAQDNIRIHGKIVFSIARLVPWKGFEMLINIWSKILKQDKNLKLVIAGDGPEKEKLENLIREKHLEKKVFLVGRIEHKKLFSYFSASDIFILNSGYEGLSHVLIEAFAYHKPVIASNKGGNKEVIKSNYNGFLIEYNNEEKWQEAILNLTNNENLKRKFAINSSNDLEKFRYKTMIDKTLETLKDI